MNIFALEYAEKFNWFVFPLIERDKRPMYAGGYKIATTDPAQINQWWNAHPEANLGLDCGRSGIIVFDLDGQEGIENWNALQTQLAAAIPDHQTAAARTGSGNGYHYYYRLPAGVDIRNSAGKLAKGIDVRACGGYVVLPPSITENPYEWQRDPRQGIAALPDALLKLLTESETKLTPTNGNDAHGFNFLNKGKRANLSYDPYVQGAIMGELAKLRAATNGTRNDTLNQAAFALGQLGLSQDEIELLLLPVALQIGLGENETRKTIASGHSAGAKNPRVIPSFNSYSTNSNGNGHSAPSTNYAPPSPQQWLPVDDILRAFERGEAGDAELLAQLYADEIAFDHSEGRWYLFNVHSWKRDRTGQITHLVTHQLAAQYLHAAAELKAHGNASDAERIRELHKRASVLRFKGRIDRVLDLAAKNTSLALTGDEWHQDSMLLAVSNGVLNLRAQEFEFRNGAPRDYLRDVIPTEWQGIDTPAPRWEKFLDEIFAGDTELVAFVQRLLGYGLTGQSTDHILPILWGEGRNGKNKFIEAIAHVLGSAFCAPIASDVLLEQGRRSAESATPNLYALRGKRLVYLDESQEGSRFNAPQIKKLTGSETITARPLHGAPVTFQRQYLLMLITNYKPHVNADDYAMRQRLLLIPFTQKFIDAPRSTNEHQRDANLSDKLRAEAGGILAWLVRGCLEFQHDGLKPPSSVCAATDEYFAEEDIVAQFITERCLVKPPAEARASELYAAYRQWADDNGLAPMTGTAFGKRMGKRFKKGTGGGGYVVYAGIGLLAHP